MAKATHRTHAPAAVSRGSARARARTRGLAVALSVAAAGAVWVVAGPVLGTDLRAPAFDGSPGFDIGLSMVVLSSALAALAGWGLLTVLERLTARAGPIWTGVATVALLVSLGGPLSGTDVSAANRWALVAMHLAVAAVLIPLLARSAARARKERS